MFPNSQLRFVKADSFLVDVWNELSCRGTKNGYRSIGRWIREPEGRSRRLLDSQSFSMSAFRTVQTPSGEWSSAEQ